MPVRCASFLRTTLVLRDVPFSAASGRGFHATPILRDDPKPQDHYATLKVPQDASPGDIKKSFYSLSKTHHPDHNPSDPQAGGRFMRISEAYAILGHAEKRAKYDRDVMRHRHRHGPSSSSPRGSYHSTGPAGGRPATGVSRRRGTFQGPPPSFFRSGGWGKHGAKRAAAHADSTGTGSGSGSNSQFAGESAGSNSNGTMGGMGPGQHPFGHRGEAEPAHFDRVGHERTHRRADERRARRDLDAEAAAVRAATSANVAVSFFTVAGLLLAGTMLPYILFGGWWQTAREERARIERQSRKKDNAAAGR